MSDNALREQLRKMLAWEDAHVGFETAIADLPADLRGKVPAGLPYSAWQLIEHLRIAQHDILDFCVNPKYHEMKWPDDYWPKSAAPASPKQWDDSVSQFLEDRRKLQDLASDTTIDLFAKIPHGEGQTYLRELILVADHAAYHIGELVLVRRLLGAWKA
jgi:DinB family protein